MPGNASVAKGSVRLDIDEAGLEASFTFTPDVQGAEWNAEKLQRLLMDRRVSQGYTQRGLDDLVQKFARSKTPLTAVIVRGTPAEDPHPERVSWIELPIPDDCAPFAEETFFRAAPPQVCEVHVEKIKKEAKVRKASALPFLKAKEETVVTWETAETRSPVVVNPEVVERGFTHAGTRIGVITPSKPGKSGKSIFGSPVTPATTGTLNFLCGAGVRRDKNELFAETAGFVRIGTNWVDVIPFAVTTWSVTPSQDRATATLDLRPGDPRLPAPNPDDIIAKAIESGVPAANLFTPDRLAPIIAKAVESGAPLSGFSLASSGDAAIRIDIDPEALTATLYLRKGTGTGRQLQLKEVGAAISRSGLKNLALDAIKTDIPAFFKSPNLELTGYVLAQGTPPGRGKDRIAQAAVTFLPDETAAEIRARYTEKPGLIMHSSSLGKFPLADVERFALVRKGQGILAIPPAQQGTQGTDVYGNLLEALPGNDPEIQAFENVGLTSSGVIAQEDGLLHFSQHENSFRLRVLPYRDAVISARVRSDQMEAYLTLEREIGAGAPLTAERVNTVLAEKKVVKGIDSAALSGALREAFEGRAVHDRLIARGQPASPAGKPHLEFLVPLSGTAESVAGAMAQVREKQPIVRITAREDRGLPGWDVTGADLPVSGQPAAASETEGPGTPDDRAAPEAGTTTEPALHHDANVVEQRETDGTVTLIAARTGELRVVGTTVSVVTRRTIEGNLTQAEGPVRFPGELVITGSVGRGAQAYADGSIAVSEAMEAALMSAGGSVSIGGGIRGAGKGIVRAKTTIHAPFAENAVLLSVDNIIMPGHCLNCRIKTNGLVSLSSERGAFVGGICKAKKGMIVAELGSAAGVQTEISFGQDYLLGDQIDLEERQASEIKKRIVTLDIEIKRITAAHGAVDAAGQEKVNLIKLLEKRSHRILTLRDKFEEHFPSEVRVRGTAHPGVILESHGRYLEIKQKKSHVAFWFDQETGRILEKPLPQGV